MFNLFLLVFILSLLLLIYASDSSPLRPVMDFLNPQSVESARQRAYKGSRRLKEEICIPAVCLQDAKQAGNNCAQ